MEKLIVAVGLNEGVTRSENPSVPITPDEIAADIKECLAEGASLFHVHARDPISEDNKWSDVSANIELFRAVAPTGALVYPTYPGEGTQAERYQHIAAVAGDPRSSLEIAPVMAGPVNRIFSTGHEELAEQGYGYGPQQSPADIAYQLAVAREHDLWVSHDIFEPGHVRTVAALSARGLYRRPVLLKFFMSEDEAFGLPPTTNSLQLYRDLLPVELNCEWLVLPSGTSFGEASALWAWAIGHGGHVRVGVGDNPTGAGFGRTNAEQVAQVVALARAMGREVATPEDVRARFARW